MGAIRNHRDLHVWRRAMQLVEAVYATTALLPASECHGLTSQMRRAVVSVPSNIAEGNALNSTAMYLRQLRIARGSLAELATQFELASRLQMVEPQQVPMPLLEEVDRMLQGLIMALEKRRHAQGNGRRADRPN